jgi:hypothetical protein
MKNATYIMLAPVQLKEGIDEGKLLEASEVFQRNFVNKQPGILRRILLRAKNGGYADLVFFESKEHADRVVEAEATSEHCQALFELFQPPDPNLPDMGVLSFEHVKTYE